MDIQMKLSKSYIVDVDVTDHAQGSSVCLTVSKYDGSALIPVSQFIGMDALKMHDMLTSGKINIPLAVINESERM